MKNEQATLPERPDHPVTVTDENFDAALKQYPRLVVDCWATWCGPCRMMAPVLEELARELAGAVVFGKLDTDENRKVAAAQKIQAVPTLLVFRDGALVERLVGFKPKPALKQDILKLLPAGN